MCVILTDTVSDYIVFSEECIVRCRTVKMVAYSKRIKHVLNRKKTASERHDSDELKCVQKELKAEIRKGKERYKRKIEKNFKSGNMKKVWGEIKLMGGYMVKKGETGLMSASADANQVNAF